MVDSEWLIMIMADDDYKKRSRTTSNNVKCFIMGDTGRCRLTGILDAG